METRVCAAMEPSPPAAGGSAEAQGSLCELWSLHKGHICLKEAWSPITTMPTPGLQAKKPMGQF